MSRLKLPSAISWLLPAILGVSSVWLVYTYQQTIVDYVRAYQYQPSSAAAEIRSALRLTNEGALYYDASGTVLEPADAFNQTCRQHKETNNPILGCYVNQRIYIFDITNEKLKGIEETTAAHELLHAAYERLDLGEKQQLDKELAAAYDRVKTPELEQRMAYYHKNEPGEDMNELHSILGTEIAGLSPSLEKHYAAYFVDRKKVLDFYNEYSRVFDEVSSKLKTLAETINSQTAATNAAVTSYNSAATRLKTDVSAFNERSRQVGGFASQTDFDNERAELLSRQTSLDATRKKLENDIGAIQTLRQQYNDFVEQYNELSNSINSSLAPTPTL